MNPYFAILIATIIWGLAGVFVKSIALSTVLIAAFRLGVPALSLLIYFWIKKIAFWRPLSKILLVVSLINALRIFLVLKGLEYTSITLSVLFSYTSPAFVMLFALLFLGERITLHKVFALASILFGILVLFFGDTASFSRSDVIGSLLTLTASLIYAIMVVLTKHESDKYDHLQLLLYQNLIGALIFLPFLAVAAPSIPLPTAGLSVLYGLCIGLVAFAFFFYGFKRMSATTSSLLTYFEVVSAIVFGVLFFQEKITVRIIVGALLIVAPLLFIHEDRRSPFFKKKSTQT